MEKISVFEELLSPLSGYLGDQSKVIDEKTGSEVLTFSIFVRCLLFGFCVQASSFRCLIAELESNSAAVSLGLPKLSRSTLKDGFSRFGAKYFEDMYADLLTQVSLLETSNKLLDNIGLLRAIDGSIFPLIKSMEWGQFRSKSKALKLHLALSLNTLCVTNFLIQSGNSDERKALLSMIEKGVTYICDRGYFSFSLADSFQKSGAYFVMRLKKSYKIDIVEVLQLTGNIPSCFTKVSDTLVRFTSDPVKTKDGIYRIVRFNVLKTQFIICTNRLDLTTLQIILLYAYRWQVELFFKYLKRSVNAIHLFSQSENGSKVYLNLMMCFVLLQVVLKQKCHKIVKSKQKMASTLTVPATIAINTKTDWHVAADWVYEMGLKFGHLFKMSANWLTYLKNSISQLFEHQQIYKLANL
jgi:hypothetical protein